jgi:hypothetical protein
VSANSSKLYEASSNDERLGSQVPARSDHGDTGSSALAAVPATGAKMPPEAPTHKRSIIEVSGLQQIYAPI